MALREFTGGAKRTALVGDITAASTNITVSDATGYPTGATAPFVIAIDTGVAAEEKVLIASRSGNTLTVSQRGFDDTTAAPHGAGSVVDHVLTATDLREANAHVNDTTGDPHPQYLTAAEGAVLYGSPVTRIPHTFTISGDVQLPSGDSFYIPPMFVPVPAGQTVASVSVRARINSGTSATVDLTKNGTAFLTGLVVTPTSTTTAASTTFADGDALALVVTAVSGSPKNLSLSVNLDYTV